jgi:hypothetical protein
VLLVEESNSFDGDRVEEFKSSSMGATRSFHLSRLPRIDQSVGVSVEVVKYFARA